MHPAAVEIRGILFSDMVGSTALRLKLGDGRADQLRHDHYELLGSAVAAHRGRVLHWTGDGVQADFPSASAAVGAALDMQRAVERYAKSPDAVAAFRIRIGVSVGEVAVDRADDSGIAVIEAARLEALAAPGEILATDLVERFGRRRSDAGFEEVGERRLKGLDGPVRVVRVIDTVARASVRPLPRALSLDRRFPLVGRSAAIGEAMQCWEHVRTGSAAAVFVSGRSGMGKSRFLAQVADRIHAEGATVLAGICDAELMVPYQPFALALREAAPDDALLAAAIGAGEGPLGPLFPARRSGRADDAGPTARFELFEAVSDLLARLSQDGPMLLVLEDLQWAAAPTVQLLRHLVQHTNDRQVLLLATYRAEDVAVGHPLHDLLVEIGGSSRVRRVELAPLTVDDVTEMVVARVPNVVPADAGVFARRLTQESAGSPFFVCELLHHLSTTGELERMVANAELARIPIPDTVRDVVGQRLARLPDAAGLLLAMAAVIGLNFDLELLSQLASEPQESVLGNVEDVVRATLLQEVDAGRFTFSHAIVRSTLLERMGATRRALAHQRVAEAIEALGRADHDELAHHWEQAGVEVRAFASIELAARRDLEALAFESAAERFRSVLAYHRRPGSDDQEACTRALLGLALAERGLGDADYLTLVEEAGRMARRLRNGELIADAAIASVWPGNFFVKAGRTEPSLVELCEDALAYVEPHDVRRIRIVAALAAHLTFDADRDRRIALLDEALTGARRLGDPELIGLVMVTESLALWDPTTSERRGEVARELGRIARATGDSLLQFFAGFFAAISACERCDLGGSRRHLAELERITRSSSNFYFGFLAERLAISIAILTGKPGVQADVDSLARRYDGTHADTGGTWAVQTAGLALQRGTLHQMAGAMKSMIDASTALPNWMPAYGLALLVAGDRPGAQAVLDEFDDPPLDYFWLSTMQSLAELAVGLRRIDRCVEIRAALRPHRSLLGVTASGSLCFGLVALTLAQLSLVIGDLGEATELAEESVRRADAMEAPYESVKSRRVLAESLSAAGGDWSVLAGVVEPALAVAQRHGFDGELDRLRALMPRTISLVVDPRSA